MQTYQEHYNTSCRLRDEFWDTIGSKSPFVISHLINPAFMGGPGWPSLRQAFITIQTPDRTILASDGLSDPYEDMETNANNAPYNGFGLEVFVAADKLPDDDQVQKTWQFQLMYQAAQLMASRGNIVTLLDEMTYLTTEFYDVEAPAQFINGECRVGAILGLPEPVVPATLQLSLEPVKLVNVKLLTLPELDYVIQNGAEGRHKLAELLIAQGNAGLSSLARPSVV